MTNNLHVEPTHSNYFKSTGIHDYLDYNLSGYVQETNQKLNNTFTNEYVEYQLLNEVTRNDPRP